MKKLLILSSLLFVFACAAFNYRYYLVSTDDSTISELRKIRLLAARSQDRDRTMADFRTERGDDEPTLACMPYAEMIKMRKKIVDCSVAR